MGIYIEYWNDHLELIHAQILEIEERLTILGYDTRTLPHRQFLMQRYESELDEQAFESAVIENKTRHQTKRLPRLFTSYHDEREIEYIATPIVVADSYDIENDEFVQLYSQHAPVPINRYPRYFEGIVHPKMLLAMYYHRYGR